MIQIYLCEDNPAQLETYSNIIKNALILDDVSFTFTLATSNPYALLEKRKENKNTGLYFLDMGITVCLKNIPNTTIPIPAENQTMIDENFFSYIKK